MPSALFSWPFLRHDKKQIIFILPFSIITLLIIWFAGKPIASLQPNIVGSINNPLIDVVVSRFAPFVALSLLGLCLIWQSKTNPLIKYLLSFSFSLAALLAGNDLLGIDVWTHRLIPFFVFFVTVLSALALNFILQAAFARPLSRSFFIVIFTIYISLSACQANDHVFYYENPDNYGRIVPDEITAIKWIRDNLPPHSEIITNRNNRHSQWIPVISNNTWVTASESDSYFTDPSNSTDASASRNINKFVAFFTINESISDPFSRPDSPYPLVYRNDAVAIYNISNN